MDSGLLELSGVHAGYHSRPVLRGLSMVVSEGSVTAIIGPNGHGKTTLLRCISGLVPLLEGEIRFDGAHLRGMEADQIVARGIVHIPQGDLIFPDMTVRDNLLVGAHLPAAHAEAANRLADVHRLFPRLAEREGQIASTLSGGERRMLSIGRGLMTGGRILLLDEPSLGLAPIVIEQIYKVIARLRDQGRTILIVEENVSRTIDIADRMYLLDHGEFVWQGAPDDLVTDDEVLKTYFGG